MNTACGKIEASCECINEDCDGTHVCKCGGSWSGTGGFPDFVIHKHPGGFDDAWESMDFALENPGMYA